MENTDENCSEMWIVKPEDNPNPVLKNMRIGNCKTSDMIYDMIWYGMVWYEIWYDLRVVKNMKHDSFDPN